jgi:hypothetical protein
MHPGAREFCYSSINEIRADRKNGPDTEDKYQKRRHERRAAHAAYTDQHTDRETHEYQGNVSGHLTRLHGIAANVMGRNIERAPARVDSGPLRQGETQALDS